MLIAGYAIGRPDFTIPAAWPASITSIAGFLLGFIGLVSLVVLRGRVALAMGLGVMGAGVALIFWHAVRGFGSHPAHRRSYYGTYFCGGVPQLANIG